MELSLETAIALLDGYDSDGLWRREEDDGVMSAYKTVASSSSEGDAPTIEKPTDRFKRARQRKKQELEQYRSQVRDLERTLRLLKEQRRRVGAVAVAGSSTTMAPRLASAWQAAALRQERERLEAEALNKQLRAMVDAALRHTRRLQGLLMFPDEMMELVQHKRLRQLSVARALHDAMAMHNLAVAMDLLEAQVERILDSYEYDTTTERLTKRTISGFVGCGRAFEVMDMRALPHDLVSASEGMWRFLAFEDGRQGIASPQVLNEDSVARLYAMDVVNGSFHESFTGRCLYRRRVDPAGRVVIVWVMAWTPQASDKDAAFRAHESFDRDGFMCLSPSSSDPARVTMAHTFYRISRPTCGDTHCTRGAGGYATVDALESSVQDCVQHDIQRFIQGMENQLVRPSRDQMLVQVQQGVRVHP